MTTSELIIRFDEDEEQKETEQEEKFKKNKEEKGKEKEKKTESKEQENKETDEQEYQDQDQETEDIENLEKELQDDFSQTQSDILSTPQEEADSRSIFVQNVDFSSTASELESFFESCGKINRIKILQDKITKHPKGHAYIEFADKESVEEALKLDEQEFRGRIIHVTIKRTNVPRFILARERARSYYPRARGFPRGRGFSRGRSFNPYRRPSYRPRFRSFHPYYQ
ncbi:pabpn1 protein-related [Anaeramoeba ignava]|uniref:Pabpn1 protein-related n=1 Tax=Anaeramoeba ignava TaxID=1746090 RepID=A0A9Q0LHF4_ANAIG|nr:pabpn1 protein-related [Anaeramoeba ignava]